MTEPTKFVVTVRHDGGSAYLTVGATDAESAKRTVMVAEGCPERSIQSCYPVPLVGMPATIHLQNDSMAAVVVKVNVKSVLLDRVETGPRVQDMKRDGATSPDCYPVMVAEGIIDKPMGRPERYQRLPNGRIAQGSIGASLGKSVSITDYRY